jgi:hypothetical protein
MYVGPWRKSEFMQMKWSGFNPMVAVNWIFASIPMVDFEGEFRLNTSSLVRRIYATTTGMQDCVVKHSIDHLQFIVL